MGGDVKRTGARLGGGAEGVGVGGGSGEYDLTPQKPCCFPQISVTRARDGWIDR